MWYASTVIPHHTLRCGILKVTFTKPLYLAKLSSYDPIYAPTKYFIVQKLSFAMPLKKGPSNIGRNINELMKHGKPYRQSVAIALRVAGKSQWMPRMHKRF